MAEIRQRIVGSEHEWGITEKSKDHQYAGESKHALIKSGTANTILQNLPAGIKWTGAMLSNRWLSNGARFYLDLSIPEYCTPETFIDGLSIAEMAGERILMHGLVRAAEEYTTIEEVSLTQRIIDDIGQTTGYHFNAQAERSSEFLPAINKTTAYLLGLHAATSSAILGLGHIRHGEYSFWQKATTLETDFSNNTTRNKPIINTKDEPHAKAEKWLRVHLTSLDPHISPWATRMLAGTVSLVLRAMEQGRGRDLMLANDENFTDPLVNLSKKVATDLEQTHRVKLMDGTHASAVDIQRKIIEIVKQCNITDDEKEVLIEWERAIDDLERDIMLLRDRSDAIAKLALLQRIQKKKELSGFYHQELWAWDKKYDQLVFYAKPHIDDPSEKPQADPAMLYAKSLAFHHRRSKNGFLRWMPTDEDIANAVINPPNFSRAWIRGKLIADGLLKNADWAQVTKKDSRMISLPDPYQTVLPDEFL